MTNWLAAQIFSRIEALERTSMKKKIAPYTAYVFQDRRKEWRWSIVSRNQHIVATSGEGYKRKGMCVRVLRRILDAGPSIVVEFFCK
jgi:uncharacterized protein YegP (UPF0339 family)